MSHPHYARRQSLRANGWGPEYDAEVWVSFDTKTVKIFMPDGREIEGRAEHAAHCDSLDNTPEGIRKPCNCT
jgi:hypothetical protein